MGRALLLLTVACGVVACTHQPTVVNPAPPGVSYRFQGDNIADANQRADRYCHDFGKHAKLQSVNHSGTDNIAVYECS